MWCVAPLEMNEGTHWGQGAIGLQAAVPKSPHTLPFFKKNFTIMMIKIENVLNSQMYSDTNIARCTTNQTLRASCFSHVLRSVAMTVTSSPLSHIFWYYMLKK
jgi:hypothetical protein